MGNLSLRVPSEQGAWRRYGPDIGSEQIGNHILSEIGTMFAFKGTYMPFSTFWIKFSDCIKNIIFDEPQEDLTEWIKYLDHNDEQEARSILSILHAGNIVGDDVGLKHHLSN